MSEKETISRNAQIHIRNNAETVNQMGKWKGFKYSKALYRTLCRKCLRRVMTEFKGEAPDPANPNMYCESCQKRVVALTKASF